MAEVIAHYEIVDRHTKRIVGEAKTLKSATRMVDRRDNEYGAYRYSARAVWAQVEGPSIVIERGA